MKSLSSFAPAAGILVFTALYAVVRYNVFKGVGWEHVPLYVLNKSVAWTSITLALAASVRSVSKRSDLLADPWTGQATALGGVHVLMSLSLLGQARYPDLYAPSSQLSLLGEVALVCGVVAATSAAVGRRSRALVAALPAAVAAHVTALGARNWLTPSKWPGHMPPITLLCAIIAVGALAVGVVWMRRGDGRRDQP